MTNLQAEIDLEAGRIRVWRACNQVDTKGLLVFPDRLVRQLAEHLVNNRAVKLQNDTRVLVEAARDAADYLDAQYEAGTLFQNLGYSKIDLSEDDKRRLLSRKLVVDDARAALAPFKEPR